MLRVRPERETDGRWEESSQAVTRVTRCLEWAPPATMSPCLHTLLNTNISCKNGKFNSIDMYLFLSSIPHSLLGYEIEDEMMLRPI